MTTIKSKAGLKSWLLYEKTATFISNRSRLQKEEHLHPLKVFESPMKKVKLRLLRLQEPEKIFRNYLTLQTSQMRRTSRSK